MSNDNEAQFVAILGATGCGKTTIGKSILQLIQPTAGNIYEVLLLRYDELHTVF